MRIIAGGIDITDRKRRELDLQRQRDFANAVADTIPSFIVVVDHDAMVVPYGANRAFCEAFGRTLEELGGTSFLEVVARRGRVRGPDGGRGSGQRRPTGRARVAVGRP